MPYNNVSPTERFWWTFFAVAWLLAGPGFLFIVEQAEYEKAVAFSEGKEAVVRVDVGKEVDEKLLGKLVTFGSQSVMAKAIWDESLNLVFPFALRVRRIVEYCQWEESSSSDSDGDDSYMYTKGWHTDTISSTFFHDSWAHHNPTYDPIKATSYTASSATVGYVVLGPEMIRKSGPLRKRLQFSMHDLKDFAVSRAGKEGFRYIGDGFFYRYYPDNDRGKFSFSNLFSTSPCTAGDIRISYEVVDAKDGISAIGTLVRAAHNRIMVTPYTTRRSYCLGITRLGHSLTFDEMVASELRPRRLSMLLEAACMALWGMVLLWALDTGEMWGMLIGGGSLGLVALSLVVGFFEEWSFYRWALSMLAAATLVLGYRGLSNQHSQGRLTFR